MIGREILGETTILKSTFGSQIVPETKTATRKALFLFKNLAVREGVEPHGLITK